LDQCRLQGSTSSSRIEHQHQQQQARLAQHLIGTTHTLSQLQGGPGHMWMSQQSASRSTAGWLHTGGPNTTTTCLVVKHQVASGATCCSQGPGAQC
jgi:hypothetical protein